MTADGSPTRGPRRWRRLPARTIRLRLTALYGGLFLACGAALLTITYVLVKPRYAASITVAIRKGAIVVRRTGGGPAALRLIGGAGKGPSMVPSPSVVPSPAQLIGEAQQVSGTALHQLLIVSGIALAIMAVLALGLGWIVAGRALRPLRAMTQTARRISDQNLHERLALKGPDDELRQLGTTFNELLARLEASFDAQRQFVANASHELRTPLTLERALVEVALADPDASVETLRHMGERVLANGEHQERLIEALLTLSRSQRGLDRTSPLDLAAVAAAALEALERHELSLTTSLEHAWTLGDSELLARLATNLIANAFGHNVPGGQVTVETATRDGHAVLVVANSGPVIASSELDRLFEPFQRLESSRTEESGGVGLGLSIVRAIARAHHATLEARPRPEGGLEVTVRFPPLAADRGAPHGIGSA